MNTTRVTPTASAAGPFECMLLGMGSGLLDELGMLDGPQQALTPHHLDLLKWQSAISVAAGASHNLALLADGNVIAWGFNDHGQLDTSPSFATSLAIPSLTTDPVAPAIAVSAGNEHSLALRVDGTVWAWGSNEFGQLGDGTTADRFEPPIKVVGLTGIVAVSAGGRHSLALAADGSVWAWGRNSTGQLGDGTTVDRPAPVPVATLTRVVAISAASSGGYHSLALRADGTLWAWGGNQFGQLGDGSTVDQSTPVPVAVSGHGADSFIAIAGGGDHSLALGSDGVVYAAGRNQVGQLGDGTTTDRTFFLPVTVPGGDDGDSFEEWRGAVAVAAGNAHSLALRVDGSVWSWGAGNAGRLGLGDEGNRSNPVRIEQTQSDHGFRSIAAGAIHSLLLQQSFDPAFAWGAAESGQLGTGSVTSSSSNGAERLTVALPDGTVRLRVLAGGGKHSLALGGSFETPCGTAYSWGDNSAGQLGHAHPDHAVPHTVDGDDQITLADAPFGDLVLAAAGDRHSLSVRADGSVWAWGLNSLGQLGDGTNENRPIPVYVVRGRTRRPLLDVISVDCGWRHSVALRADGTVWSWGANHRGQLGDGTKTQRRAAVLVTGLSEVVAIAAGDNHCVALRGNGTVWTWGANDGGQLGNNSKVDSTTPVPVVAQFGDLGQVKAVAAGSGHSLALLADGTVVAWGVNGSGQLGDGTTQDRPVATIVRWGGNGVGHLQAVKAVAAGHAHSLALVMALGTQQSNTRIFGWGANPTGVLGFFQGDTTQPDPAHPVVEWVQDNPNEAHSVAVRGATALVSGAFHAFAFA